MKKLFIIPITVLALACNNSKKDAKPDAGNTPAAPADSKTNAPATEPADDRGADIRFTVEGTEITNHASVLVSKDKENLQAGLPYLCILTANGAAHNNEYLSLNFLLDLKPGTYPVVGSSLQRGKDADNEMYGGILGGKPKLTDYKVNITACEKVGEHSWLLSGTCDEVKIKAMGIMLMDKSKHHPEEITVSKISFTKLRFDDNLDEMMEKFKNKMKPN